MSRPSEALEDLARAAAFRLLLASGRPVGVSELAGSTGQDEPRLRQVIDSWRQAGRVRMDAEGKITGAAGLSVVPDRHEVEISGRRFWTWCAYDILGIFGALEADGSARSVSPANGETIDLTFAKGRPESAPAVLFRPDESLATSCENVYEQWCPNSNLFPDKEAAVEWAQARKLKGQVLSLEEASALAAPEWRRLTEGLSV